MISVCGGGGLSAGILKGLQKHYNNSLRRRVKMFIGETEGCNCLDYALENKKAIPLEKMTSCAKSLASMVVTLPLFNAIMKIN